jgi:hypothetical protein
MSSFFNYDLNMRTWRDYCKRVEQYRLQFTMQKKIQTLDSSSREDPTIDPDLPPELRAALAAELGDGHYMPPRPFSASGVLAAAPCWSVRTRRAVNSRAAYRALPASMTWPACCSVLCGLCNVMFSV